METPNNQPEMSDVTKREIFKETQAEMYVGFEQRLDKHKSDVNKSIINAILIIIALYILSQYLEV